MMLLKIALRNLSRQKRRSALLGGALSFGMFVLVVVNGATGGITRSLQKNFADLAAGHIFLIQAEKGADGKLVSISRDDAALLRALKASGVKYSSVTRRTVTMGSVIFSGDSANRQIAGVNWADEASFPDGLNLVAGNAHGAAGTDGIVLSDTLAENIGLIQKKWLTHAEAVALRRDVKARWRSGGKSFVLDKEVERETGRLVAEREAKQALDAKKAIGETVLVRLKTAYGQENVAEFRVAAIFRTQLDYSAYVDRALLDSYLGMPEGSFNICGVELKDFGNLEAKTARVYAALKGSVDLVPYRKVSGRRSGEIMRDLEEERFIGQRTIVTNLNNELGPMVGVLTGVQIGSYVLFLAILAVIMVGLVNTFRIVVYERTKEIGTMRALGAQCGQIRNLFVTEAMLLGVAGTVPGAVLGSVALAALSLFRFDAFKELSLFLDGGHLGFAISVPLLALSLATVMAFTLLAALIPARKAAHMEPAQALRSGF
jgi:putative ABC transport system permease protein